MIRNMRIYQRGISVFVVKELVERLPPRITVYWCNIILKFYCILMLQFINKRRPTCLYVLP